MAVTTYPNSALQASTGFYTDEIGGGIGGVVVTTGGGNGANVADPTGRNDDGFRGPLPLGFTLSFFGGSYTQFWINNNGNISFVAGISAYAATGPQGATQPIISPYFSDVDTRGPLSGVVHYRNDIPNQHIITWDNVGFYNTQDAQLASFQLVLRGPGYPIPLGEGPIGFFWKNLGWEVATSSGALPAAVGFGDGSSNGVILACSLVAGVSVILANKKIWWGADLAPARPPFVFPPRAPRVDDVDQADAFLFGVDFDILDDLSPTFALVGGKRNLANAIARRLITQGGSLAVFGGDPEYGYDLRSRLNKSWQLRELSELGARLEVECLKDPRIESARVVCSHNLAAANLLVKIELETAAGPFALMLKVSDVTVELLRPR